VPTWFCGVGGPDYSEAATTSSFDEFCRLYGSGLCGHPLS
jgi:hypothetical protein